MSAGVTIGIIVDEDLAKHWAQEYHHEVYASSAVYKFNRAFLKSQDEG
jgi:hypothetical protein